MPENRQKVYNALGLCMRAGKCVFGAEAADAALQSGKAHLVLIDANASENTTQRLQSACRYRSVPWLRLADIGKAIGREGRMVIVITEAGFAGMIKAAYEKAEKTGC